MKWQLNLILEKYLHFDMNASSNIQYIDIHCWLDNTYYSELMGWKNVLKSDTKYLSQQLSVQSLEQMSIWVLFTDDACVKLP